MGGELGNGAFATVYKCTRLADKEQFAVKVFCKETISKNKKHLLYKVWGLMVFYKC